MAVYPNPTSSFVHLDFRTSTLSSGTLTLQDAMGKEVAYLAIASNAVPVKIDVSALKPGVYFVTYLDKSGTKLHSKMVKMDD